MWTHSTTNPIQGLATASSLSTTALERSVTATVLGIIEWLAGNECHELDDAGLVAGFARRLAAAEMPLAGPMLSLVTSPRTCGCR
jgi:hypothetical protein